MRPRPGPALFARPLGAPIHRPILTLLLTAIALGLAGYSASRIAPATSMRPMFPQDDPATDAMIRVMDQFRAADNLMLLVDDPRPGVSDARARAHALAFAARLRGAIRADPAAASRVTTVMDRPAAVVRPFIEHVVVPAGVYYLDDAGLAALKKRLAPRAMRERIRRNQALIAAASPAADVMARRVLRDPLGLSELLMGSMGSLRSRIAPGAASGGGGGEGLFGRDGRTLLIRIGATHPAGQIEFTKKFMAAMRAAVQRAAPGPLRVAYTGGYPIAELSATDIRRDMIWSVIGSLVLLQALFLVVYRRPWVFPVIFAPVAGGILAGFGVYALFSLRLTPVTAASGAILAGLGVDYCIHYLAHYHEKRAAGFPPARAARSALALAPAMVAACVTSLVGFVAIAFSSVPALRDFAWIGALGLGGAFAASLLVLPAVLMLVDRPRTQGPRGDGAEGPRGEEAKGQRERGLGGRRGVGQTGGVGGDASAPRRLAPESPGPLAAAFSASPTRVHFAPVMRWVDRRRGMCIAAMLGIAAGGAVILAVLGPVGFSADLGELNPQPNPPLRAQDRLGRLFPGAMRSVQVYIRAPDPEALLRKAHAVDAALARGDLVRREGAEVFSIASLLPDPAAVPRRREQAAAIDADKVVADFRAAIADSDFNPKAYDGYARFLHKLLDDPKPPTISDLARYPALAGVLLPRSAFADHPQPVTQTVAVVSLGRTITTPGQQRAIDQRVRGAVAPIPGATATGIEIIANDMQTEVRRELARLLSLAAVAVAAWLVVTFRSPIRVALTLVPAAFAGVVLAAVMRLWGQDLNIVNVVAMPLLAGIGVDDGIFMVSLAGGGGAKGQSPKPAGEGAKPGPTPGGVGGLGDLRGRLAASGHAITMTSLTTVIGFGSLGLTSTPAIRSLGLVLGVGMAGCWAGSVFLLGPLLLTRRGRERGLEA